MTDVPATPLKDSEGPSAIRPSVRPPWNEAERLGALDRYSILDTPREPEFDDIARLAADVFEAPIAVVNLVAAGRQWFKAEVGIGTDELPLDVSICAHAILQPGILVVPDTTKDDRFASNPLVTGDPGLRFYAGALLETPEGLPLGTVCVLDTKPRAGGITERQRLTLEVLARQAMAQLEMRRAVAQRDAEIARARASEERLRLVLDAARDYAIITMDPERRITDFSAGAETVLRMEAADATGRLADEFFTPEDRAAGQPEHEIATAASKGRANDERWHQRADRSPVFLNGSVHPLPRDAAGRERGFIKIARDETERRAAEAAARNDEARLARALAAARLGTFEWNLTTGAVTLDDRSREIFGFGPNEGSRAQEVLDRIHPDDLPRVHAATVASTESLTRLEMEYRIVLPDGTRRSIVSLSDPIPGQGLKPERMVGVFEDVSEREAAEAALRETTRRLDAILSNTREAVFLMDHRQHCAYANAAAEKLTGYSFAELQSRPLHDVIHHKKPDGSHYPLDECPIDRAFPERAQMSGEELFVHKDGSFYPVGFTASPVLDDDGKPVGTVIEARNISEEKARDAALRETEERYRLAAQATNDAIWDWDLGTDRIRWNEALTVLFGHAPEELETSGAWWIEHVHPDDRERVDRGIHAVIDGGQTQWSDDYRFLTSEGGHLYVFDRGTVIRDEQGRAVRMIGAMLDLTERRRAEAALRELNDNLERRVANAIADRDRTWNNARDLLGVADAQGRWVSVNPAWTRVLGWDEEEILNRTSEWLEHPDDRERTRAEVAHLGAGGTTLGFENRFRHKDGSYRWISWAAVTEHDLIYASGREVTAEKERQAELEQAQEALRQAQKMEAVGQLTGGIAHDFNNLLTGVIGSLDMMQRRIAQGQTDRIERYTNTALTAANRAAALTHRLLAFSRRQPLDPKPVNANGLVTGMEELLRRTIGESIRLEIVTAGGLWQTLCDPHQLESAILNLAINGRDAMPAGGTLTIETCNAHLDSAYAARQRDLEPGQYVCVAVTDTGTGMPRDVVEKAFDPFFTTKPIGQGTGLGLSMIYGFARQSDGYARIYSEVDRGTTVKLYLPRYYGEAEDASETRAQFTEEHRAGRGETVLVVEDESAVRALVMDVLEELGYRAIEASDGPSGLKVLQSDVRIDLLVTDVGLPGLNGRQLADAARQSRPNLKVLFITGYAENAAIASGFLEPGMQMVTKPFAIETLATRIRDMIEAGDPKDV